MAVAVPPQMGQTRSIPEGREAGGDGCAVCVTRTGIPGGEEQLSRGAAGAGRGIEYAPAQQKQGEQQGQCPANSLVHGIPSPS